MRRASSENVQFNVICYTAAPNTTNRLGGFAITRGSAARAAATRLHCRTNGFAPR